MPKQKGSSKVRTGCRTCKTRKVKCDEAKPSCVRCKSSGRKCGGYEVIEATRERSLTWYRPQQLTAHDQREGRAFQFFGLSVGPVMSGMRDSYFWTHLVMQFSHFSPAVRHAVLAISSLYEDFQNGRRVSNQLPSSSFAIHHYAASIRHIQSVQDESLAVLASVLYLCVEFLFGDMPAAQQHCRHGIAILSRGEYPIWVREHLLPIFKRLSTLPFFSNTHQFAIALPPTYNPADASEDAPFTGIEEAEDALEYLEGRAVLVAPFHRDKFGPEDRTAIQADTLNLIEDWQRRAVLFEASLDPDDINTRIYLQRLRAINELNRVRVGACLKPMPFNCDEDVPTFRKIVAAAEEVVRLKKQLGTAMVRPAFTFEEGLLPALSFTANVCRDLVTRVKALELMPEVAAPKEGAIDVGTLYRTSRRVIEIEHEISLDNDFELHPNRFYPMPPLEKRIRGMPMDHQLEAVTNADGSVSFRRQIRISPVLPDGEQQTRIEYITDDMIRNRPGVPSMRCARASA